MRALVCALALGLYLAGPVSDLAADEVRIPHAGLTVNANLERVEGNWPQGPVVLLTHGTLAHRGMEIIRGLQTMLRDRGVSSLAINLSLGLDDRAAAMYDCKIPHTHRHIDAVAEIGAWLGWLKAQGAGKVALLGHSRGGNQTARFTAAQPDPAVTQVILVAPQTWTEGYGAEDYKKRYGTDLAPLLEQAGSLSAQGKGGTFLESVDFVYCEDTRASADAFLSYHGADPDMDTPALIPRIQAPVLVIAGSEDQVVAGLVEKVEPLADGARVRLLVLDGADHFFRDLYSEEIADAVAQTLGGE